MISCQNQGRQSAPDPATGHARDIFCQACTRPGKREPGFSIWTLAGGNVCAVEAVQDPAGYMLGKKCLERGLSPDPAQIADSGFDMKSFVAG